MTMWKQIPFEPMYEVSDLGQVRNKKTQRVKSLRYDKYGYQRVTLYPSGKTYSIHRLVLRTFDPDGMLPDLQVNHIDNIKTNNSRVNLEWSTVKENCNHRERFLCPLRVSGSRNPMVKITEQMAWDIKYCNPGYRNNRQLGDLFGVSSEVVRRIRSNERWKHL